MSSNRRYVKDGYKHGFDPMGAKDKRPGGPPQFDKMTIKLLNLYLEKKWLASARMLDLSNMGAAEEISELAPNLNHFGFCQKLAQAIAEGKPWAQSLDTINFANNDIYTLKHLSVAFFSKDIKILNISFTNNKITDLTEVDWLVKFRLREVMFTDNAICSKGNEYHTYVVKKLRTIELLDTVSVKDWRMQLLPKLPDPKDSCMTDPNNVSMVMQICTMYFKYIDDGNYDALVDAYDNEAFFTHTTQYSSKVYTGQAAKQFHNNLQYKNHNLMLAANKKNPCRFTFKGRTATVEFLKKELYAGIKTKHDVTRFKADAVTMGDSIIVTIHGIFDYTITGDRTGEYSKCFDRVFVLKPNKAGTEWPARIANDMMTTRAIQDFPMCMPDDNVESRLAAATGLNSTFVSLLLKEAHGDYDSALNLFTQNKERNAIPPEAFAH